MNNKMKYFIAIYLILLVISITLFCYKASIFNFSSSIDYQKFDSFGSFISGIVSVITIILIYQAFQEQIRQSDFSKEIQETDIINRLYSEIINEINNLEYKENKGINALYNFDDEHRTNPNSIMNHLCLIFVLFEDAINSIKESKYLDNHKKNKELTKIYLLFYSKLVWSVYQNIYDKLYEDYQSTEELKIVRGLKRHNDSVIIFDKYKKLTADTYAFLLQLNLVTLPTTKPKMISIINGSNNENE